MAADCRVLAPETTPEQLAGDGAAAFVVTRDGDVGISDPRREIDLCECHDCFAITELLNTQDLRFCAPGDAAALVRDGETRVEGSIPVNPSGGLKCFGHPIGATGCRMIYQVTRQLQGRALGRQVPDARIGLAHNLGGPGAVASVTILGSA